jgi:hypothetical protein
MKKIIDLYNTIFSKAEYLAIPALLGARLYVAWVFFKSGLTKLNNWEGTLELFEYEYVVPVLDSVTAAYLATFVELVCGKLCGCNQPRRHTCRRLQLACGMGINVVSGCYMGR